MTTIPTALLIIAGLIVILLLVRAFRPPSEEKRRDQLAKLRAQYERDKKILRDVKDAAQTREVVKQPTASIGTVQRVVETLSNKRPS